MEPDRLSQELTGKLEAARMTAEALSLDAQLARDTVGRWIRGRTVPTLAALRAVENVLSDRLGYPVDLAAAVKHRRSAGQRSRELGLAQRGCPVVVEPSLGKSLVRLLDPRLEIVDFVGRQVELADLVAWCLDGHGGRLRLITGPGGVGKTRLSVELVQRMTAATALFWPARWSTSAARFRNWVATAKP